MPPLGLLALALAGCGTPTLIESAGPISPVILDESAAAAAISRYRAQHGLGPVTVDAGLVTAAAFQAGNNARTGQLSHEVGGSFTARMASAGLGRSWSAENLSAVQEIRQRQRVRRHHVDTFGVVAGKRSPPPPQPARESADTAADDD